MTTVVFPDLVYNKGYLVVCGTTRINQRITDLKDAQTYGTILTRRCFDKMKALGKFSEVEANAAEELLQKAEYEFGVRGA